MRVWVCDSLNGAIVKFTYANAMICAQKVSLASCRADALCALYVFWEGRCRGCSEPARKEGKCALWKWKRKNENQEGTRDAREEEKNEKFVTLFTVHWIAKKEFSLSQWATDQLPTCLGHSLTYLIVLGKMLISFELNEFKHPTRCYSFFQSPRSITSEIRCTKYNFIDFPSSLQPRLRSYNAEKWPS